MIKKLLVLVVFCLFGNLQAEDKESIKRGKKIYDSVCFACHGKSLEGATGFNLKDGEWVHGNTPEQIKATIVKGFPEKGMLPFGTMYKDDQIQDIVNFIISRQEGLRDMTYEIYQGVKANKPIDKIDFSSMKPQKYGKIIPAYADLNIPEVDNFGIINKGKLIVPESGNYTLVGGIRQNSHIQIFIDGKELEFKIANRRFNHKMKLEKGTYSFELRYVKIHKYSNMNLNLKKPGYDIPLSKDSYNRMKNQQILVGAKTKPLIMRKRIEGLPTKTIAVAYPEKVNFAFNPLNGSINGHWVGEFLDLAPNINGRGNRGSKPQSKLSFSGDKGIDILIDGKAPQINYIKYSTLGLPTFTFTANGKKVELSAKAQGQDLVFTYKTDISGQITLALPKDAKVKSSQGTVEGNTLTVDSANNKEFSLVLAK
ncbi:MAG: c-type cytochrome [Lentisphaeraceae bacterium]|nr:c-type cytochrome [Lentisphaeraceae bacterium]